MSKRISEWYSPQQGDSLDGNSARPWYFPYYAHITKQNHSRANSILPVKMEKQAIFALLYSKQNRPRTDATHMWNITTLTVRQKRTMRGRALTDEVWLPFHRLWEQWGHIQEQVGQNMGWAGRGGTIEICLKVVRMQAGGFQGKGLRGHRMRHSICSLKSDSEASA